MKLNRNMIQEILLEGLTEEELSEARKIAAMTLEKKRLEELQVLRKKAAELSRIDRLTPQVLREVLTPEIVKLVGPGHILKVPRFAMGFKLPESAEGLVLYEFTARVIRTAPLDKPVPGTFQARFN